jgi:hypothetical protein
MNDDHPDGIREKLDHLQRAHDLPSDVITSTRARRSEGERQGRSEGASTARSGSAERAVYDDEQPDERHCAFVKADGGRCKGWAIKDGSGLCSGHSGRGLAANPEAASRLSRERAEQQDETQERLGQGVSSVPRPKTPLEALRAEVEADPEGFAKLFMKAAKEGRDVRALTAIYDRLYGEEAAHVDEPHTFDELAKLSREQRRALITQLERAGRGSPFRAPEH